ncbi:MAG: hypothetical protein N5P05_001001 [Chroococcopsis gigantea SAG 12.99]|jgi:RNA polymerase sigma factor (sigma-70 family)|nr:sigma-70 family RNA polymerase sigma factor [Chlorogloea purpurea SAG 13.99]MDV2999395.1 hypothetical protein [Chroococcopsis gigantea SAG 12.99]
MNQSDSAIDQRLTQLMQSALGHPQNSSQRRIALNKLIKEIQTSGKLGHPQRGMWPDYIYHDLYNEALGLTFMEICQKLDKYNPQYPVMAWVNFLLKNRFIDAVRRHQNYQGRLLSLDDLDKPLAAEEDKNEVQQVRDFINDDPENLLAAEHIKDHPDVTLQRLLWLKDVEDKKWKEISAELSIAIPTLSSFYQRSLRKLERYFRKYLYP